MLFFASEHPEELVFPTLRLGADGEESTADLGLEDDDERDEADAYESPEYGGKQLHLKGVDKLPDEEDGHDAHEDADGCRAFQQPVEAIKEQRHQQDVDDVYNPDLYEEVNHVSFVYLSAKIKVFFNSTAFFT